MATQTADSHHTCTSDEQTEKLSTLSTSEEKTVDFQVEPPVNEAKKCNETPVLDLPVHDNVELENETTSVAEVSTATSSNETPHEERPSNEPVGGEATELPVIAFLEKSIKEFDAADNGKSPPEEQPTAEVIQKETLEVPAAASEQKVEEQSSEIVAIPKLEDESSSNIVDCEEKEKWGAGIHIVTDVAERVETVSVSVEKIEEKKPKIMDNTESSAMADSGKGPADAEEKRATECISVEKEPDKEPGNDVPEEPVEPPKKEAQPIDVVPMEEIIEVVAKEFVGTVEPPTEEEQPVEVHSFKGLEEVTAKEISIPTEVPKEKEQKSVVEAGQESREVIVHPAKEKVVAEKEANELIEPPKNKEQADEGFSVTKSEDVKQKEANEEVKDGIGELAEITKHVQDTYVEAETVIDGKTLAPGDETRPPVEGKIREEDGGDKQESVFQMTESGPTQDSVKGPEKEQPATEFVSVEKEPRLEPETTCVLEESVEPPQKDAQAIEAVPVKEPVEVFAKEVLETVEPPTEKNQPVVAAKEISEVVSKEVTEKVEPPAVTATETSESIKPLKNKEQPDEVISQKESVEIIAQEVSESFDPPKINEQADEGIPMTKPGKRLEEDHPAKEFVSVNKESREEPVLEKEQPETTCVPELSVEPPKKEEAIEVIPSEQVEVIEKKIVEAVQLPTEEEQPIGAHPLKGSDVVEKEITEPKELCKEEDQAAEVLSVQESTEVKGEKISESVEIPKESELLIEVQVVKELEFIAEDTSEAIKPSKNKEQQNEAPRDKESEVTAKEIRESLVPSKDIEQANEGFPVTESEELGVKEVSGSKLGAEEVEKREPEVTKVAPRDYETDPVLAGTKIEKSITDEKVAAVEVKDEQIVRTEGEVPKVNEKKEVASKPSHKHSHNILSKVRQSLVKAKKAIIGKSPTSKTLSSQARDDIKVK